MDFADPGDLVCYQAGGIRACVKVRPLAVGDNGIGAPNLGQSIQ